MSVFTKKIFDLIGFVILVATFTSCGRKVEPRAVQESPDLRAPSNPVSKVTPDAANDMKEHSMNEHASLDLMLHNSTGGMIDETAIIFGSHSCTFGVMGNGTFSGYLGWSKQVGTNPIVRLAGFLETPTENTG